MNSQRAILKFRSLGISGWHQIGWRDSRVVFATRFGDSDIHINTYVDCNPVETGVLIWCRDVEPEYCFAESDEAITTWAEMFLLKRGNENEFRSIQDK